MRGFDKDSIIFYPINGQLVPMHIRYIKGSRHVTLNLNMGSVYCSVGSKLSEKEFKQAIENILGRLRKPRIEEYVFQPMLDWPKRQVWYLGRKRRIDPDGDPDDPDVFIAPRDSKNFAREFDCQAIEYIRGMIESEAARVGIEVPESYSVKLGRYMSKYASYRASDHLFEFDRRLLAFQPIVIRSVVDHEICHIVRSPHDRQFYAWLYALMDRHTYWTSRKILTAGRFDKLPD